MTAKLLDTRLTRRPVPLCARPRFSRPFADRAPRARLPGVLSVLHRPGARWTGKGRDQTHGVGALTRLARSAGDGLDQEQAVLLMDYWVLTRFDHRLVEHDAQCRGGCPDQVTRSARVSHGQRLQQLAKGETSLRKLELESPDSQRSADRPPQLDPQAASL